MSDRKTRVWMAFFFVAVTVWAFLSSDRPFGELLKGWLVLVALWAVVIAVEYNWRKRKEPRKGELQ